MYQVPKCMSLFSGISFNHAILTQLFASICIVVVLITIPYCTLHIYTILFYLQQCKICELNSYLGQEQMSSLVPRPLSACMQKNIFFFLYVTLKNE